MKKQIQVQKEKLMSRMPDGLSQMEMVRFIYIELGKIACFDERYWLGNVSTQKRIYKSSLSTRRSLEDLQVDRRAICTTISSILRELLAEVGIESELNRPDPEDPHTNLIVSVEEKRYILDLQRDLEFIQTNRKTRFFGEEEFDGIFSYHTVSKEQQEEMDRKIGYLQEGIDYTESYIHLLKKAVDKSYLTIDEKVAFILEHAGDYKDLSQVGIVEKSRFYNWCLAQILNYDERKATTESFLEEKDTQRYLSCMSVRKKDGDYVRFLYSEGNHRYMQIEEERFEELLKERLKPISREKIPGVKKKKIGIAKKEKTRSVWEKIAGESAKKEGTCR